MTTENSGAPNPQALLAELRAQVEALRRERDEANDMLSTARSKLQMMVMAHAACWEKFMPGRPAAALDNAQAFLDAPRASRFVSLDAFRGVEQHRDALLRGLERMRQDGLDIDDLTTAPTWTGKVLVGERVVFDLAELSDDHLCGHGAQTCDACTDSWSIRERALVARAEKAEAAGAAMRVSLDHLHRFVNQAMVREAAEEVFGDVVRGELETAWRIIQSDAGAAMLERVRRAEQQVDALRESLTHTGLESAAAIRGRDAAQKALAAAEQQRDEAREALRLLLEEAGDPERQGDRHTGDGLAMSQPCRDAVARILEVEP